MTTRIALFVLGCVAVSLAAGCAQKRTGTVAGLMTTYCAEADRNPYWCDGRGQDAPDTQRWQVVSDYCAPEPTTTGATATAEQKAEQKEGQKTATPKACEVLATVPEPFSLVYDMRLKRWSAGSGFGSRGRDGAVDLSDPSGKPSVLLAKNEKLGVVIDRVNPMAYKAEEAGSTLRDIEGLASLQAVLSAAGGAISGLANVVARSAADANMVDQPSGAAVDAPRNGVFPFPPSPTPDQALGRDLTIIREQTEGLRPPLSNLQRETGKLEAQLRRLQAVGRELNRGRFQIGTSFDSDIEQPATWTRLFEALRSAKGAVSGGITSCRTLFEKYIVVATSDADKPLVVQTLAQQFRREGEIPGTQVKSSCALPNLQSLLMTSVTSIETAAALLARRPSSEWAANAGSLREVQGTARDRLALPAARLLRQVTAFASLGDEIDKILAREPDVRKQAAVSQMLTTRVANASLRKLPAPSSYTCGTVLTNSHAMFMTVLKTPPEGQKVTASVTLFTASGTDTVTREVVVPARTEPTTRLPLQTVDVEFYHGCKSFDVKVDDTLVAEPNGYVAVGVHDGFVLIDKLFVHERAFTGSLTKVQTDKVLVSLSQPKDFDFVIDGPDKVETSYDIRRRQGSLFGANIGVIYTPAVSRSFSLVDPTPLETIETTTTVDNEGTKIVTKSLETKRVQEQSRESRAGQTAAFLNLRLGQALFPQSNNHFVKPGVEVGFGLDVQKPSIMLGGSFEVFRYLRLGVGRAWVSTTDIADASLLNADVDPSFVVPTDTKFRPYWYSSLTFALDSLSLFSK